MPTAFLSDVDHVVSGARPPWGPQIRATVGALSLPAACIGDHSCHRQPVTTATSSRARAADGHRSMTAAQLAQPSCTRVARRRLCPLCREMHMTGSATCGISPPMNYRVTERRPMVCSKPAFPLRQEPALGAVLYPCVRSRLRSYRHASTILLGLVAIHLAGTPLALLWSGLWSR
jgi:hypothetical protein